MARFKNALTPGLFIAAVLVLGLLGAGSAALMKGAPVAGAEEVAGAEGPAVDAVAGSESAASTAPTAEEDMPRILPMPPKESTREEAVQSPVRDAALTRGVSPARLQGLLLDAFGGRSAQEGDAADGAVLSALEGLTVSNPVTRADAARAVAAAMGLEQIAAAHAPAEPIFRDVPAEHEAFAAIALLERLGLYPFHVGTLFAPDGPIEEAELKFTIDAALALDTVRGPVVHVNAPARTISVEWTPRHATAYIAEDGSLIVRNGEVVTLERLRPGDEVHVVADGDGRLFLAAAEGPEGAGASDELMALLREMATPEQLAAIISRDWDRAAVELKGSVYKQLLARGATPEEAEALLAQDWTVVEERTKERLTELITDSTDVNEALVRAVLDRDWESALSFIEVEVLEYVLNYLAV